MWNGIFDRKAGPEVAGTMSETDIRQLLVAEARQDLIATRDLVDKASLSLWLSNKDQVLVDQLERVSRELGDEVRIIEATPETWWPLRVHLSARLGQAAQLLVQAGAAQPN